MTKALISGATSGIGYEFANIMAAEGHDLILVSRDLIKLADVQKELQNKYGVQIRVEKADLSVPGAAAVLHKKLNGETIDFLINNAGAGLVGDFFETDLMESQRVAYLNMNSLLDMTHVFGNDMVQRGSGKILNVASIVAFFPGPKQPVYYATKSFVRSLSRALAYNLRNTGVTVTALHPGVTKTNFFNAAHAGRMSGGASAHDVARTGYDAMMAGKIEVTHGFTNKLLTNIFARFVPYRLQPVIVDKAADA